MPRPPRNPISAGIKTLVVVDQAVDMAWTGIKILISGVIMIGISGLPHKPISQLSLHQVLKFYLVYDVLYVAALVWIVWQFIKDRGGAVPLLLALYAFQIAHAWIVTWPMYRPYTSLPYRKIEFIAYTVWKIAIALIVAVQWLRGGEPKSLPQGVTV